MFEFVPEMLNDTGGGQDFDLLPSKNHPGGPASLPDHDQSGSKGDKTADDMRRVDKDHKTVLDAAWKMILRAWGTPFTSGVIATLSVLTIVWIAYSVGRSRRH